MNFYKHHIGDYTASTVHLSALEDCFYRRMLDAYYLREKPLPVAEQDVCRLVRAQSAVERKAVKAVLAEFFEIQDDGQHQKRCDEEVAQYRQQADTNRRIAADREAKRTTTNRSTIRSTNRDTNRTTNRATIGSPVFADAGEPSHKPEPEPKPKPEKSKADAPPAAVLFPEVDKGVLRDFAALRAKKRAPLTETVAKGLRDEAAKAGIPIDEALRICCVKGWQAFDASWNWQPATGPPKSGGETAKQREAREFFGHRMSEDGDGNSDSGTTIDGQAERIG